MSSERGYRCAICGFHPARLDLPLPAGTYFVEISDSGNNQIGGYNLIFEPIVLSGAVPALAPDVIVNDSVSPLGDLDLYTFSVRTSDGYGMQVTATGVGRAIDPCLRIMSSEGGNPGAICGFPAARLDLSLPAGTYFVEISDSGNNQIGGYDLIFEPIVLSGAVPALAPDVIVNDSVSPLGDLDLYTF